MIVLDRVRFREVVAGRKDHERSPSKRIWLDAGFVFVQREGAAARRSPLANVIECIDAKDSEQKPKRR